MEYGCIGKKLPHSFSKTIHEKTGEYEYTLTELTEEQLDGFMRQHDFRAINVTIPYKERVIPYLSGISPTAASIGAVNTIINRNGSLYGYNTDLAGLNALFKKTGVTLAGKKVVITGSGGTSKTAFAAAKLAGAGEIVRVSRTSREDAVSYEELYARHTDAQVIINTTPVGMYPDIFACPVEPERFPRLSGVIDAVYNPLRTVLVTKARALGIPASGGLYMLTAQAIEAYGLFTESTPEQGLTENIFAQVLHEKTNIVLTGMPGSGKSTVGRLLAERTGRRFIDTDEEIVRTGHGSISGIFADRGEAYFRELESEVIRGVAGISGAVIATGGGAILRQENTDALKMNGRLYFLDRPLNELLPTPDRPLALDEEAIRKRYEERYGLYLSSADERIRTGKSAQATADVIERTHNQC